MCAGGLAGAGRAASDVATLAYALAADGAPLSNLVCAPVRKVSGHAEAASSGHSGSAAGVAPVAAVGARRVAGWVIVFAGLAFTELNRAMEYTYAALLSAGHQEDFFALGFPIVCAALWYRARRLPGNRPEDGAPVTTATGSLQVPYPRGLVCRALAVMVPYCAVCDVTYLPASRAPDGPATMTGGGATFTCLPGKVDEQSRRRPLRGQRWSNGTGVPGEHPPGPDRRDGDDLHRVADIDARRTGFRSR